MNPVQWYESVKAKHKSIHQVAFKLRRIFKAFGIRPQYTKPMDVWKNDLTFCVQQCSD